MRIAVPEIEKRTHQEWLDKGEFMDQVLACSLKANESRPWDGWIHASNLDWSKAPQKQFDDMLKPYNGHVDLLRTARAGNVYHDDLNKVLDKFYQNGHAWVEQKLEIEPYRFHGTPDRVQFGTPVGNVLFEFKTEGTYERDKTGGERLYKKIELNVNSGDVLTRKAVTTSDLRDLEKRLYFREKPVAAKDAHLTQAFTYAWVLQDVYKVEIHRIVLAYIRRDTYKIPYFSYTGSDLNGGIERAKQNYVGVYGCLEQYNNG